MSRSKTDDKYAELSASVSRLSEQVDTMVDHMSTLIPVQNKLTDLGCQFDAVFKTDPGLKMQSFPSRANES